MDGAMEGLDFKTGPRERDPSGEAARFADPNKECASAGWTTAAIQ